VLTPPGEGSGPPQTRRKLIIIIPPDMTVPTRRRDTSKPENVRWLLRNLAVRNSKHPRFDDVFEALKSQIFTG